MTSRRTLRMRHPLAGVIANISALLDAPARKVYACGGFVRDLLLGRETADIDITISDDPLEAGPRLAQGLHGTYFSLDTERHHARVLVPSAGLHIDLLPLRGAVEEDLRRRDFTVNAMAAPLAELATGQAEVIDPTGGLADLETRTIRVVSEQALLDDPLRVLRGARLATQLDFTIEPYTAALLRQHAPLVRDAAFERQRDELMGILATGRAGAGLRLLDTLGLLSVVLPELDTARGVQQPDVHHWDVFGHSIEAVAALDWILAESEPGEPQLALLWRDLRSQFAWWPGEQAYWRDELSPGMTRRAVLKLAGLLHDIGKPETRSVEAGGRIRFFGHADAGAETADRLLRRLRFPTRVVAHARAMVDAHLRPLQMALEQAPSRRAVYRFFRDTGDAGIDTLFLTLADHAATAGPRITPDGWRRHVAVLAYILALYLERPKVSALPKLVEGEDLMKAFSIDPGPLVGELLEAVREAQAAGEVTTKKEAVEHAGKHLARKRQRR